MENIILSLESTFHRIEKFILWHNRYASLLAFTIGHGIFYAVARAGLKPYCAITLVVFIFHVLDCIKKKRVCDEEKNLSELTKLILRSYRYVCNTNEKLNIIKSENRAKYSIIIMIVCLILSYIGMKINGYYVSYLVMLILFTLPAIIYHKLITKLLKRLAPILEQLDQSMEYKRRTLIDRKDLLVKMQTPGLNEDNEDEDISRLKQQQEIRKKDRSLIINDDDVDEEENEQNSISTNDESKPLFDSQLPNSSESNFDVLTDSSASSSSSAAVDDEAALINELYANVGDKINGRQCIRIKGAEVKVKGRPTQQRSNVMTTNFFQTDSASGEPDLTGFDFLNDYDDKS
ncbi:unnamed protein product [Rotaria magnacalcarata]|uniref:RETREG1-3/ARL6IP-like N-terminal reticulon-homology domain-containing protein n=1 Tax=Rotaria magnacalcarata TaxID=392030 RepID=A0A816C6S1_9BILA|nr:unnamed protein product [Rotaria magnacalcarata]CAF1644541.1 unnamed protein product [Rotaria magnacalcarata]CAF2003743.1 unnamed protein product [Rotaria magnacalcarata]